MKRIDYAEYLDRTHGSWMGKSIGGTIGAPYEGAKEIFHFDYSPEMVRNMIPNDDLDLQVLWLSVLEEKGVHFTSDDLAEAFLNKCPYAPGEYAIFKKNYARGVHPPFCGSYNNRYYLEGMGCPIRSEVWACIAPGNPELAANLAEKDGILDHAGNSVYAERFLAGLESAAFFENDLHRLVDIGLSLVPGDSRFARLVHDVREWSRFESDWKNIRWRIIREYGHPDCTNMFQNMGFTLMALLLGEKDFIKTVMMGLNSGYDTDCVCATSGAILGTLHGADFLMKRYGFEEQRYILGVDIKRRSDRILDLAEDCCLMGVYFTRNLNRDVLISGAPAIPEIRPAPSPAISVSVDYQGTPAIGIGDQKTLRLLFENLTGRPVSGTATILFPNDWECDLSSMKMEIDAGETITREIVITIPRNIEILYETNILETRFYSDGMEEITYRFGLVGATVWEAFGPFWENRVPIPELKPGESYYSCIPGKDRDDLADNVRSYHLNAGVDAEKEYMRLEEALDRNASGDLRKQGMMVNFYEDLISANDAIGYQGPCAIYMVRRMISPDERTASLLIGHTDAFKLWFNGALIAWRDQADWWTGENVHIHDAQIKKGENIIIVKLIRRSENAKFSLVFTKKGACSEHYTDFASLNPELFHFA